MSDGFPYGAPGPTGPTGSASTGGAAGATGATAIAAEPFPYLGRSLSDGLHTHSHFEMSSPPVEYPALTGPTFALAGPLDLLTIAAILVVALMIATGRLSIRLFGLTPAAR